VGKYRHFLLLILLAFFIIACTSVTKGGTIGGQRQQFMLVSSAESFKTGNQFYLKEVADGNKKHALDTDEIMLIRLHKVANRLIPQTEVFRDDAPSWKWEVHTIKSDTLNAYCTGQGKIMFYTGIVDKLALSDDEIAAIMGHEMAHALREHIREQMSQAYAQNFAISVGASVLGLGQIGAEAASQVAKVALNLPFSRAHESEADTMGLELMARAGYDPEASVTLWQKMSAASKGAPAEFFSTHPSSEHRIEDLQQNMQTANRLYSEATRKGIR
jgi:Zn-dependent protease with chaperone function